jgi:hypothetical protein
MGIFGVFRLCGCRVFIFFLGMLWLLLFITTILRVRIFSHRRLSRISQFPSYLMFSHLKIQINFSDH